MRFDDDQESDNIEDRRGIVSGGGLGLGAVALALLAWYFGIDPRMVLNFASQTRPVAQQSSGPVRESPEEAKSRHLVGQVLRDTERTWDRVFTAAGRTYEKPRLVLFRGATSTACGTGEAAMGPFYCPGDRKVYIDLGFYDELARRFAAPGEFAQAYVIAHEIGHHVQNLAGISGKVHQAQQAAGKVERNALSVRLELQADCFAGVWANQAVAAGTLKLEEGDVESAINAATAIGDDTLQRQAQGRVVPDSFTHGSSEQRVRWFRRGLEYGKPFSRDKADPQSCNTFGRGSL
ncbi:neutral zinc metallopeptidase [Niveibacterium terrae]|uniref:KPN_02809 family neutral zinc metallopeptidase n=1 Tax=Niveibacterium terrae TaxID=3373598 RepID=UPI003A8EFB09